MKKSYTLLACIVSLMAGYLAGRRFSYRRWRRIAGPRYLIINADDFGLSDGVTQGIIQAWRDGVVSSTSAIVNIEGATARIAKASKAYPNLPIGLHLNITLGKPVLPPEDVPTLIDEDGNFHNRFSIFQHLDSISLKELQAELQAQADLLIKTGIQFDHIDYHQHMMVLHPPFYPLVCELAKTYGVPVRQPVPERIYGQIKVKGGLSGKSAGQTMLKFITEYPNLVVRMVPQVIPATYEKQAMLLDIEGIKTTNWLLLSLYDRASVDNFISVLQQLPPGISEMVMHPAIMDAQLQVLGGTYVEQRADELAMLTDPRVKEALLEHKIKLIDFSML